MRKLLAFLIPLGLYAADPAGFHIWKSSELKAYDKSLAPKMDAKKVATEQLGNFGNHAAMVAHREASGEAELHDSMTDVFVVQSGSGTVVVGGKIRQAKTTAPGEVRGASIEGGSKHAVSTGDILHIPAKTPHQVLLDAGKPFTYFVIKVETK